MGDESPSNYAPISLNSLVDSSSAQKKTNNSGYAHMPPLTGTTNSASKPPYPLVSSTNSNGSSNSNNNSQRNSINPQRKVNQWEIEFGELILDKEIGSGGKRRIE